MKSNTIKTNKPIAKVNYDLIMQKQLQHVLSLGKKPTLLLHSCCAPCSSYVLKVLQRYFEITVFFYNSNLYPTEEYLLRLAEQKRLIKLLNAEAVKNKVTNMQVDDVYYATPIKVSTRKFNPQEFYKTVKGFEAELEGGNRCYLCYMVRMNKAGAVAKQKDFDYFTTTLSVSPYKNAQWVNEVGKIISDKYSVEFLYADFKKNDGYKKSIEYSKEYQLYRQIYCGCEFSFKTQKSCL